MVVKTSAIGKCDYYCFEFFQPRRVFIEIYREPFFPTCISFRKQTWKTTMSLRKKYGEQAKKMGTLYFRQGIPHSEAHMGRIGSIPTLSNVQEHIQGREGSGGCTLSYPSQTKKKNRNALLYNLHFQTSCWSMQAWNIALYLLS